MKKSDEELNKICSLLMEGTPEKEELDSLLNLRYHTDEKTMRKRTIRILEILQYFMEIAKKTTLIDDPNLKLYDDYCE